MFCILAFMVLGILGIFSASHRRLAREALDCVLRRMTLRPCITGFDVKLKSRILGSVINRSETAARLLNKYFELLSWIGFVLMVAATVFALRGTYLFYVTGSCSGSNEAGFCLFDPSGKNNEFSAASQSCPAVPPTAADLNLAGVDLSLFPTITNQGKGRIVLIGCYGCSYTRKVYPGLKKLAASSGATFVFLQYPVKVNTQLMTSLGRCVYQQDPKKYWGLNDLLFAAPVVSLDDPAFARRATAAIGLPWEGTSRCLADPSTKEGVNRQLEEITRTKFFGTPTVFINDRVLIGPKPYRVYAIALKGFFYWL